MLPEFKRTGSGFAVGTCWLGLGCRCECGAIATTLATFRITPQPEIDGRPRSPLGSLLLCDVCTGDMVRVEASVGELSRCVDPVHYMSIKDALVAARAGASEIVPREYKSTYTHKWLEIFRWMASLDRPIAITEMVEKFGYKYNQLRVRLEQHVTRGVVEKVGTQYRMKRVMG